MCLDFHLQGVLFAVRKFKCPGAAEASKYISLFFFKFLKYCGYLAFLALATVPHSSGCICGSIYVLNVSVSQKYIADQIF